MSIESAFHHSCEVETREIAPETTDLYSVAEPGRIISVPLSCCFLTGSGGTMDLDSGKYVQNLPIVLLPPTVIITEGMKLTGQSAGWEKKFIVRFVDPITTPDPSHYRCSIEEIRG